MHLSKWKLRIAVAGAVMAAPHTAMAQDLLDLDDGSLRSELQTRYDAGLEATLDPAIYAANDPRYIWASETKVQCAIAIGFMKSSTRDPVSIGKCQDAYLRMQEPPAPPPPPPPPPAPEQPAFCSEKLAGIVFFEFDSAVPPQSATQTVDAIASNYRTCGWQTLTVTGHADRSGSDTYNEALSVRRADSVASLLSARGVVSGNMAVEAKGETEPRVPTADGERNPQNRRVEITVD